MSLTRPRIQRGTKIDTTSGTSHDFTGIPSWAKRITFILNEVSTNGTAGFLLQIGDSGGLETTGYISTAIRINNVSTTAGGSSTSGFYIVNNSSASYSHSGSITLVNIDGDTWIANGSFKTNTANVGLCGGSKTLTATLDRLRLTTTNGTDAFDAGSVNIMWE